MTEEELKKRAEIYNALIEFPAFQFLVKEMNDDIDMLEEAIVSDIENNRIVEKALRAGIKKVIETPINAIKEAEQYNENSEPRY